MTAIEFLIEKGYDEQKLRSFSPQWVNQLWRFERGMCAVCCRPLELSRKSKMYCDGCAEKNYTRARKSQDRKKERLATQADSGVV